MEVMLLTSPRIPLISSYDNDLEIEEVGKLLKKLNEAFEIAANAGVNPGVKWGDNDESDAISGLISAIFSKYQDRASFKQRSGWN